MQISYFDESGDDGFPRYSSPHFVLSSVYLHYLNWKNAFDELRQFRRDLRDKYSIPIKWEFHTKYFLLNKKPYRTVGISDEDRISITDSFCDLIASMDIRVINVAIVKPRIQNQGYEVLDTAVKYLVQRIENDLDPVQNPENKFMIITDPGRVGKMRSTTRRIQRINYIPSKFGATSYRSEIRSLVEDPLPKDSRESYFIQIADLASFIVYLYAIVETGYGAFHGRMPSQITPTKVYDWLSRLQPSLNLLASTSDPYGVKFHPD